MMTNDKHDMSCPESYIVMQKLIFNIADTAPQHYAIPKWLSLHSYGLVPLPNQQNDSLHAVMHD